MNWDMNIFAALSLFSAARAFSPFSFKRAAAFWLESPFCIKKPSDKIFLFRILYVFVGAVMSPMPFDRKTLLL